MVTAETKMRQFIDAGRRRITRSSDVHKVLQEFPFRLRSGSTHQQMPSVQRGGVRANLSQKSIQCQRVQCQHFSMSARISSCACPGKSRSENNSSTYDNLEGVELRSLQIEDQRNAIAALESKFEAKTTAHNQTVTAKNKEIYQLRQAHKHANSENY